MVGVTPVVIGTLPLPVSQLNFPDDDEFANLHIDRHASDVVQSLDDEGNWAMVHPGGTKILMTEGGATPDFEGKDYDKIWKITRNEDKKKSYSFGE
jgi:hypothetical protein